MCHFKGDAGQIRGKLWNNNIVQVEGQIYKVEKTGNFKNVHQEM